MTKSSTSQSSTNSKITPVKAMGEHWYDLTATLKRNSREEFGDWLTRELEALELELSHFSTALSLQQTDAHR